MTLLMTTLVKEHGLSNKHCITKPGCSTCCQWYSG